MRRLLLLAAIFCALAATGTMTYAAGAKLASVHSAKRPAQLPQPAILVVPDLRHQAFVFAKGTLQDGSFAWRIVGRVHGFPANVVVRQSPAPGTKVLDTGAPLVTLTLSRNPAYRPLGEAQDFSPYPATALRPAP